MPRSRGGRWWRRAQGLAPDLAVGNGLALVVSLAVVTEPPWMPAAAREGRAPGGERSGRGPGLPLIVGVRPNSARVTTSVFSSSPPLGQVVEQGRHDMVEASGDELLVGLEVLAMARPTRARGATRTKGTPASTSGRATSSACSPKLSLVRRRRGLPAARATRQRASRWPSGRGRAGRPRCARPGRRLCRPCGRARTAGS